MNVISTYCRTCNAFNDSHCAANRSGKCFRRFSIRRLINYPPSIVILEFIVFPRNPRNEISARRDFSSRAALVFLRNYGEAEKSSPFSRGKFGLAEEKVGCSSLIVPVRFPRNLVLSAHQQSAQLHREEISLIRGACEGRIRASWVA